MSSILTRQKLYDRSRWQDIRLKFRETFLSLYALPSQPVLSLALSAGLSALRLPSCAPYVPPDINSPETTPKSPLIPLLPAAPPLHSLGMGMEDTLYPGSNSYIWTEQGVVSFRNDRTGMADAAVQASPHHSLKEELHEHPDMPVGNVDCPTCGPDMKVLAKECAMSHHVNSTIVCRISGRVMDSDNQPMAFPNGYVYSSTVRARLIFQRTAAGKFQRRTASGQLTDRHCKRWPRTTLTLSPVPGRASRVAFLGCARCTSRKASVRSDLPRVVWNTRISFRVQVVETP